MAKRRCFSEHSPRVSKRGYDRSNINELLEALFAESDLVDASFDDLVESRSTDSDQNEFIQRALHFGSVLLEAGNRSARKHSFAHNASVWPLPPDLTSKVFSMLDTPSVLSAAATCLHFRNCAKDPLCYANIDFTLVPKVNDAVVSTLIQRVGIALQSIKLGVLWPDRSESSLLTSSCLSSLTAIGGATGSRLRRLHLYNIQAIDNIALSASLSVCPSLVDLEIVCLNVDVNDALESVSRHCRLLESFIYESDQERDDVLETPTCKEFVLNCPKITTLALKACGLHDSDARKLMKGFHKLKYVDFTKTVFITGSFYKNLGTKGGANSLEVMILHDCCDLDQVEVKKFTKALLAGEFRLLRHLDISNNGLAYNGDYLDRRFGNSFIAIKRLLKQRPNFCLVAELDNRSLPSQLSNIR